MKKVWSVFDSDLLQSLFCNLILSILIGAICVIGNYSIGIYLVIQLISLLGFIMVIANYENRLKLAMTLLEERDLFL